MLFSSLQMAGSAMNASTIGIQVAGQNLTNVNTPGYVREQTVLETASPYSKNGTTVGNGVSVTGVRQMIDLYLEERVRNALSDANGSSQQNKTYTDLETLLGELSVNDISSSLTGFFNAIDNVLNEPENVTYRKLVAGEGQSLAEQINYTSQKVLELQIDLNKQVDSMASQINELVSQVQSLNVEISRIEAGAGNSTEAVGLRDQRYAALTSLSQLINIRTHENENGVVSVFCGSDPLIVEGTVRKVSVKYDNEANADLSATFLSIEPTGNKLDVTSGQLHGLYVSRDEILGNFAVELEQYATSLIWEFNKLYASGQGLTGYSELTSINAVEDADAALNEAGLDFPPVNGSFRILLTNSESGKTSTTDILVLLGEIKANNDPFGVDSSKSTNGTSLNDLADAINAIDGLTAVVTTDNRLEIKAESPEVTFAFDNDTSGVLNALGVNTFFTGSSAKTIGVNQVMYDDPTKFAASSSGVGADTQNAELLASMPEMSLSSLNNQTITEYYRNIYNATIQKAGTVSALAVANSTYYASLESQKQSISGVNLDEETINLLAYQRSYQATARYVTVINEMLESLLNM